MATALTVNAEKPEAAKKRSFRVIDACAANHKAYIWPQSALPTGANMAMELIFVLP